MSEEGYKPSEEEIKKAEEAMSEEQRKESFSRSLEENKGEAQRTLFDYEQQYRENVARYLKERADKNDMSSQEVTGLRDEHFVVFFNLLPEEYPKERPYPTADVFNLKDGWTELNRRHLDGYDYEIYKSPDGKLYRWRSY